MIYYAYAHKNGDPPKNIIELKPHNVDNFIPWLTNKNFSLKKKIIILLWKTMKSLTTI